VRVREVPELLEGRQLVADRRAGDAEAGVLGDRLAPDGLAGAHELLDDGAQHLELPGSQLAFRHGLAVYPREC
jgi:hypothetical protein